MKSDIVFLTATAITPPVEELKSGRYKCVTHCTKSEFDPERIDEAKAGVREEWEKVEGVTVESVDFVQVKAPETIKTGYIWSEDAVGTIEEDHTDIIVVFRVESPVAFWLIALAVGLVIGFLVGLLVSGALTAIAKFLYEYPEIVLAALAVLAIIAIALLAPRRRD